MGLIIKPTRRAVLGGLGATAIAPLGCSRPVQSPPKLKGRIRGRQLAERGHRVRSEAPRPPPAVQDAVDIVIVGGGVAGLAAGWRLARAGFGGSLLLLEVGAQLGGTSAAEDSPAGAHPLGAHYITLPNPACRHVRRLLEEIGVITGWQHGRPVYDEAALCFAPQERLFAAGVWGVGLWPHGLSSPADDEQLEDFDAHCQRWTERRGADGLRAFEIPVKYSSQDPEITELQSQTFAEYIKSQGWDSEVLRWYLEYGCRDDFGSGLEQTSAWAGLHYHCARAPDPGNARDLGTRVLTWPGGNGRLVRALAASLPGEALTRAVARSVEPLSDGVRVDFDLGIEARTVRAKHVVLAVPSFVATHLVADAPHRQIPGYAPWRVASLHVDRLPRSQGLGVAWDSAAYGGASLGYVCNTHQTGSYGGPSVLTWYQPLPVEERAGLLEKKWGDEAKLVMQDLAPLHPDLRERVHRLDLMHWGHGTAIPAVGLDPLAPAPRLPRISFAHSDLSGMSLFEEASWHGVRAAEEAMSSLGLSSGPTWL